jgi:hypothetical protein
MASRRLARPLVIGTILIIALLILRVVLSTLLPPAPAQTATFITTFLAILMVYIFFIIVPTAIMLSGRVPKRIYDLIEKIIIAGIVLGVIGMFQPWVHVLYRIGFLVLLVSTLAFIVWSHVTSKAAKSEEETGKIAVNELNS